MADEAKLQFNLKTIYPLFAIIMLIHLLRAQQTELAIVKHAKIKPLLQNLYVQNKIIHLASLAQMTLNTSYAGQLY